MKAILNSNPAAWCLSVLISTFCSVTGVNAATYDFDKSFYIESWDEPTVSGVYEDLTISVTDTDTDWPMPYAQTDTAMGVLYFGGAGWSYSSATVLLTIRKTNGATFTPNSVHMRYRTYSPHGVPGTYQVGTVTVRAYSGATLVGTYSYYYDGSGNSNGVTLDVDFSGVNGFTDITSMVFDTDRQDLILYSLVMDEGGGNSAPTDVQLSNNSVNQSASMNATVGTLSTTDPDGDDTHAYTLVAGTGDTHNGSFNLSGSSLRANNAGVLAAGNYSVRVQTDDDNGGTYAEAFTITVADDVAPVVSGVSVPANATYRVGEALVFTVNFNEAVTVTGTPMLGITIGEEAVLAAYEAGDGTTALTFDYTVHSGDEDTDGVEVGTFGLAGASIRDAAGNDVNTTLNNLGATVGVLVDAVAPYVVSITRKNPVQPIIDATTVVFEVVFSEDVTGVNASLFALTAVNDGNVTGTVAEIAGGPATYDVTVNLTGGVGEFRLDVVPQ